MNFVAVFSGVGRVLSLALSSESCAKALCNTRSSILQRVTEVDWGPSSSPMPLIDEERLSRFAGLNQELLANVEAEFAVLIFVASPPMYR